MYAWVTYLYITVVSEDGKFISCYLSDNKIKEPQQAH